MNDTRYEMKKLPEAMRPREKALKKGLDSLNDTELLAIIVRQGSTGISALELAGKLLARYRGFRGLKDASLEELMQEKGIGPVKALEIKTALELGQRLATENSGKNYISCPEDVSGLFMEEMRYYDREHLKAVYLDTRGGVISHENISIGGLSSSVIHPREVFKPAVKKSAASLILVHNHPSGDPTPSPKDVEVSRKIAEAGELLGITLFDHVIIGDGCFCSLKSRGLL